MGLAVGIDLGTSNSCVAYVQDGVTQVVANERGERTHASVVSFLAEGSVVIGNQAKRQMVVNQDATVSSVKRLMGRFFFSAEVRQLMQYGTYKLVEGPNKSILIEIRGKKYTPPQMSAMILEEMRRLAEKQLGEEVDAAVITVPAHFNDNQRNATREAGEMAGMKVLRIINEPTAAALAYGVGKNLKQRVAIYDLGGGTFDMSILEVYDTVFQVLGTAGDTYLGGDDIDYLIMDHLADVFHQKEGKDLKAQPTSMRRLKNYAEWGKIWLSSHDSAYFKLHQIFKDETGTRDLITQITRRQLNTMSHDLIQRTFMVCDECLRSANLRADDIEEVILVGGQTRMPLIQKAVSQYFNREIKALVNPDEAVAVGAAVLANRLSLKQRDAVLLDVTPLSLRIATVGGYTDVIIAKNTTIPCRSTKLFTTAKDNQEKVKIKVLQGETKKVEGNELLGEFEITGLPQAPRGEVQIEVSFKLDANGIVNVMARDMESQAEGSMEIRLIEGLGADKPEESITERY